MAEAADRTATEPGRGPDPTVSVVLPTYNEEGNAARIVAAVLASMEEEGLACEVLVMDDRSRDRTVAEVRERFGSDPRVRVVVREGTKGLALSIKEGVSLARGGRILVMDSDFNHDPVLTGRMAVMARWYDIVSGSRFSPGGGMESRFRHRCSAVFNWWIRLLLWLPTRDNLAGFFCIRRERLLALDHDRLFDNYGDYFFRLLHAARRRGWSIVEIPVFYRERTHGLSKTQFFAILWLYTRESIKLRLASWLSR